MNLPLNLMVNAGGGYSTSHKELPDRDGQDDGGASSGGASIGHEDSGDQQIGNEFFTKKRNPGSQKVLQKNGLASTTENGKPIIYSEGYKLSTTEDINGEEFQVSKTRPKMVKEMSNNNKMDVIDAISTDTVQYQQLKNGEVVYFPISSNLQVSTRYAKQEDEGNAADSVTTSINWSQYPHEQRNDDTQSFHINPLSESSSKPLNDKKGPEPHRANEKKNENTQGSRKGEEEGFCSRLLSCLFPCCYKKKEISNTMYYDQEQKDEQMDLLRTKRQRLLQSVE
ncbi:MAG: hypothetical protein FJX00_03305 [Alphaproteobacteria bacterium]|nr:hypothetical protein [Alphaproteobacteria bacterium]